MEEGSPFDKNRLAKAYQRLKGEATKLGEKPESYEVKELPEKSKRGRPRKKGGEGQLKLF